MNDWNSSNIMAFEKDKENILINTYDSSDYM